MKRTLFAALFLGTSIALPIAKGDGVYYEDDPAVRTRRVYTDREYVEPRYSREVRVYHREPVRERVIYREDRPHYILPPGPHRIIQHILFGDPWE